MKVGRTFNQVPDLGDLGQYTLNMVIEGADKILIDFGSRGTLEWGYGNYGLIFDVPAALVFDTETPDYPIECAFSVEDASLVGAAYLNNSEIDLEAFRAALDEYGYEDIEIVALDGHLRPSGWKTEV